LTKVGRGRKQIRKKCQISTLRVVFTIFSDDCNSPFPLLIIVNVLPNQPKEKKLVGAASDDNKNK